MANATGTLIDVEDAALESNGLRLPILYEDDEEGELGESNPHVVTDEILHICIAAHLRQRRRLQVFSNMNLYYPDLKGREFKRAPYVSPDTMIVKPFRRLPEAVTSYYIGRDGPAPKAAIEVLSQRSAQQRDKTDKVTLYALLKVAEYILVDVLGHFLPERLVLKRLRSNGTWKDEQDSDGGVTSRLGFRLIIDTDGQLSVLDAKNGRPYIRPNETEEIVGEAWRAVEEAEEARKKAEARAREQEAELARLRRLLKQKRKPKN